MSLRDLIRRLRRRRVLRALGVYGLLGGAVIVLFEAGARYFGAPTSLRAAVAGLVLLGLPVVAAAAWRSGGPGGSAATEPEEGEDSGTTGAPRTRRARAGIRAPVQILVALLAGISLLALALLAAWWVLAGGTAVTP